MNKVLTRYIDSVRCIFNQRPDSAFIGYIKNGSFEFDETLYEHSYSNFLHICDGLCLGTVVLFGTVDLLKNQYMMTEIEGGTKEWLCIGHILYENLVINRLTGNVFLFHDAYFYKGFGSASDVVSLGNLEYFLLNYVFGELYLEISPSKYEDEWYIFLKENNFID